MERKFLSFVVLATIVFTVQSTIVHSDITLFPDVITTPTSFAYATPGYDFRPHHTRLPFSVSKGGKAFVAYPNTAAGTISILEVNPAAKFAAVGKAVTFSAVEVSGIVAHDDGFAVLCNIKDKTTTNGEPTAYIVRYTNGVETWKTPLNGKTVTDGIDSSSDTLVGDLVWNGSLYSAYFVVHGASGGAAGHYGDSIQYVAADGTRRVNDPYSTTWGCSHNEGIAIVPTTEQPFLSICSNDWQTGIYLNTDTRSMSGPKLSNDHSTAGYTGEPFGGVQGSYSVVSMFKDESAMMAWSTHGSLTLTDGGQGATMEVVNMAQRWNVHNVAVAPLHNKSVPLTTVPLTPGSIGDENVLYLTKDANIDHVNVHTATYSSASKTALVTYESVTGVTCTSLGTTCSGTYVGTSFQLVDGATGTASGKPLVRTDVFISGDIRALPTGELAWPYVNVAWDLGSSAGTSKTTSKISFATLKTGSTKSKKSTTHSTKKSTKKTTRSETAVNSTSASPANSMTSGVGRSRPRRFE